MIYVLQQRVSCSKRCQDEKPGELEYEAPSKAQLVRVLKQAAKELSLIQKGKLKSRPAKALPDEL